MRASRRRTNGRRMESRTPAAHTDNLPRELKHLKKALDELTGTAFGTAVRQIRGPIAALETAVPRRDDAVRFLAASRPLLALRHIPLRFRRRLTAAASTVERTYGLTSYTVWLRCAIRLSMTTEKFHRVVVGGNSHADGDVVRAAGLAMQVHEVLGGADLGSPKDELRLCIRLRDALDSAAKVAACAGLLEFAELANALQPYLNHLLDLQANTA